MPCVFCGSEFTPDNRESREHVFPQWLADVLPGEGQLIHELFDVDGTFDQTWTSDGPDFVVREICERCNNGWMSRLEVQVRPILEPMIVSRARRSLDPSQRGTLATWAMKTALTATLTAAAAHPWPAKHYRHIERWRTPPPTTHVWLAAYEGRRAGVHVPSSVEVDVGDTGIVAAGNGATLVVGRVVLQVFALADDKGVELPPGPAPDYATLIWPFDGPCYFPGGRVLTDDGSLMEAIREVAYLE